MSLASGARLSYLSFGSQAEKRNSQPAPDKGSPVLGLNQTLFIWVLKSWEMTSGLGLTKMGS